MAEQAAELERLVEGVLASRKYRRLLPEFVAALGRRELARARRPAEAALAEPEKEKPPSDRDW